MKHFTIEGYTVDCYVENIYYELAEKFILDNDNFYVPRMIKYMISERTAQVCYEMPGTAKEISKKLGWPEDEIEACFREAMRNGTAHRNAKNGKVSFSNSMVNLADFGVVNPEILKERGQGFIELVRGIRNSKEYLDGFGDDLLYEMYEPGEPIFRVLPKWKAIKDIPGVMPCEDLKAILEEQEKISAVRCMCRTVQQRDDEAWEGELPEEGHCIKFGPVATHYVEDAELGRYMTVEEVMANLETLEDKPIYHMIGNSREQKGGFCNCCSCCCDMRMGAATLPSVKDAIKPSRFLAESNLESCIGCGKCIELCPFEAISADEAGKAIIDAEKCMGCGICVINCPVEAISFHINKPADFIPIKGAQHIEDSLNLAD